MRERDATLRERMDDPDCDPAKLRRTYRRFAVVNRLFSRWDNVYAERMRPLMAEARAYTLLDIGAGAGDVGRRLRQLAAVDGRDLRVTAIDPDPVAAELAAAAPHSGVVFRRHRSGTLVGEGAHFDFCICNHLLHHLEPAEVRALAHDAMRMARLRVLFNDLSRSRASWAAFASAGWLLSAGTFIHEDGLISIRRSYTPAELIPLLPDGWTVTPLAPWRLLAEWTPTS